MEAGSEDERKFIATVKQNSEVSLWSTIIGIGMDLARDTVEETSKTPGCNYATVISNKDFKEMINNEFDYTVVRHLHTHARCRAHAKPLCSSANLCCVSLQTPTGFNVSLSVDSDVWQLHSGYGSPEVSSLQPGGQAQHSTLFPSTQNDKGETRGGLFLFKLSQKQDQAGLDTPFTLMYVSRIASLRMLLTARSLTGSLAMCCVCTDPSGTTCWALNRPTPSRFSSRRPTSTTWASERLHCWSTTPTSSVRTWR
jgi:hypothetical protein